MLHQYKLNGYNIVLDTCSGAVHSVDEVVYDIIALFESKEKEEIIDSILDKYKDRSDVTREEILLCFEDIENLRRRANSLPPIPLSPWPIPLKTAVKISLKPFVFTWLTVATSTANIVLQVRANTTVTAL